MDSAAAAAEGGGAGAASAAGGVRVTIPKWNLQMAKNNYPRTFYLYRSQVERAWTDALVKGGERWIMNINQVFAGPSAPHLGAFTGPVGKRQVHPPRSKMWYNVTCLAFMSAFITRKKFNEIMENVTPKVSSTKSTTTWTPTLAIFEHAPLVVAAALKGEQNAESEAALKTALNADNSRWFLAMVNEFAKEVLLLPPAKVEQVREAYTSMCSAMTTALTHFGERPNYTIGETVITKYLKEDTSLSAIADEAASKFGMHSSATIESSVSYAHEDVFAGLLDAASGGGASGSSDDEEELDSTDFDLKLWLTRIVRTSEGYRRMRMEQIEAITPVKGERQALLKRQALLNDTYLPNNISGETAVPWPLHISDDESDDESGADSDSDDDSDGAPGAGAGGSASAHGGPRKKRARIAPAAPATPAHARSVPKWSNEVHHAITGHWQRQEYSIDCTDKFLDIAIDILSTEPAHFNPRYINVGIAERIALLYEIAKVARAQEMYCEAYYNYLAAKQVVYGQYLRQMKVETAADEFVESWLQRRLQRDGWKVFQEYKGFLEGLPYGIVNEKIDLFAWLQSKAQWTHLAAYAVAVNLENVYRGRISQERHDEAAQSDFSDPYNLAPWLMVNVEVAPTKNADGQGHRFVKFLKPITRFVTESHALRPGGGGADESFPQHSDHLGMVVRAYDQLEAHYEGFGRDLSKVKLYQSIQDMVDALPNSPEFRRLKTLTAALEDPKMETDGIVNFETPRKQIEYRRTLDSNGFPDVQKRDYILKAWRETLLLPWDDDDHEPLADDALAALNKTAVQQVQETLTAMGEDAGSPQKAREALEAARDTCEQGTAGGGAGRSRTPEPYPYGSSPGSDPGDGVVFSGKQVPQGMAQRIAAELAKDDPDSDSDSDSDRDTGRLRPVHRATRPLQLQPLYRRFHSSLKF